MAPESRALTVQGWIQVSVTLVVLLAGGLLGFSTLSAKADIAVEKANAASAAAKAAETDVRDTREQFIRSMGDIGSDVKVMRALLDERLPKKGP